MDDEKILFKKIPVEVSYSNNLKYNKQFKIKKYIYIYFSIKIKNLSNQ